MENNSSLARELSLLKKGWRIQLRVVSALLLREMLTRYGRNNIGFLWLFIEPMMFTLVITALWTATRSVHGSNIPIVAFALTGYSAVLMWRNMPSRCIGALRSNVPLLFHRQVKLFDVYISRILLEFLGASVSFVTLAFIFSIFEMMKPPEDALKVLVAWLLLGWFGAALAVLVGSLSERFDLIKKFWPPFSYILFPLSGAAFIVDAVPPAFREIVLYLPMIHAVEMLREGFFGSDIRAHYDVGYLVLCNVGLTLFALSQLQLADLDPSEDE